MTFAKSAVISALYQIKNITHIFPRGYTFHSDHSTVGQSATRGLCGQPEAEGQNGQAGQGDDHLRADRHRRRLWNLLTPGNKILARVRSRQHNRGPLSLDAGSLSGAARVPDVVLAGPRGSLLSSCGFRGRSGGGRDLLRALSVTATGPEIVR